MLRKILINYEFIYNGGIHQSYGVYVGDTNNPRTAKNKDYTADVVCLALKMTHEDLAKLLRTKYWDINKSKLEANGFKFNRMETDFYPPVKKGEM